MLLRSSSAKMNLLLRQPQIFDPNPVSESLTYKAFRVALQYSTGLHRRTADSSVHSNTDHLRYAKGRVVEPPHRG